MIYDAIINGARSLGFYGGNIPDCWSAADASLGWNWTFWYTVLKGLVQEINASSPVAPALVATASNQVMTTSDSTTQAISRSGGLGDLWVFAARSGPGTQSVTISGLPFLGAKSANVYTESRTVTATNGSFTDTFDQWDAHVYHFVSSPTAVSVRAFTARRTLRGVVLRWRTGSDVGLAGFEVYRAGRRVNRRLIAAGGAGNYTFVDRTGRVGGRYRLQTVSLSGRRIWAASTVAR